MGGLDCVYFSEYQIGLVVRSVERIRAQAEGEATAIDWPLSDPQASGPVKQALVTRNFEASGAFQRAYGLPPFEGVHW